MQQERTIKALEEEILEYHRRELTRDDNAELLKLKIEDV